MVIIAELRSSVLLLERRVTRLEQRLHEVEPKAQQAYLQTMRIGGSD